MLIQCDDSSIPQVVEYIGEGKCQCFYLYADMLACGTLGENFGLWISEDGGKIQGVAYRYYATLHLYSHDLFPKSEALALIEELRPKCITGPQASIEQLLGKTHNRYKYELSHIITADRPLSGRANLNVTEAGEEDIPEIAAMMMEDPVYQPVYTYERLCQEIRDRYRTKLGRLFVLKDRAGQILASSEINVETSDFAVTGAVISSKRVRGLGFGSALTAYTWNLLLSEGKRAYAFVAVENDEAKTMDKKIGLQFLGQYARLLRNDD